MSLLTQSSRKVLTTIVREGVALELFPGNDGDDIYQSTDLLYELTHNPVFAIGKGPYSGKNVTYIDTIVPPYPEMPVKFDYILANEIYVLIGVECGFPIKLGKNPMQGINFINNHLNVGGYFIISDEQEESIIPFKEHLMRVSKYQHTHLEDVSIFRKL